MQAYFNIDINVLGAENYVRYFIFSNEGKAFCNDDDEEEEDSDDEIEDFMINNPKDLLLFTQDQEDYVLQKVEQDVLVFIFNCKLYDHGDLKVFLKTDVVVLSDNRDLV